MPYLLSDYSALLKEQQKALTAGVVDTLRKYSWVLDAMPFPNTGALAAKGLRIKELPTLQNRKINEIYTHANAKVEPIEETGYLFGGKCTIDRVYDDATSEGFVKDLRAWNVEMYAKALAYGWNNDFINNTALLNEDSIVGLHYRIDNDFPDQEVDADGPDISPDAGDTDFNQFFDAFEECMSLVEDGPTHIYMNRQTWLRIQSGLRRLGLLAQDKDQYGRKIMRWGEGGPELIDIGTTADQSTQIIGNDQDENGDVLEAHTFTSLYMVRYGADFLTGWQLNPLQSWRVELGMVRYVELDWYAGLFITNPRSVARLVNFTVV